MKKQENGRSEGIIFNVCVCLYFFCVCMSALYENGFPVQRNIIER